MIPVCKKCNVDAATSFNNDDGTYWYCPKCGVMLFDVTEPKSALELEGRVPAEGSFKPIPTPAPPPDDLVDKDAATDDEIADSRAKAGGINGKMLHAIGVDPWRAATGCLTPESAKIRPERRFLRLPSRTRGAID
jgi:rubredoxin